MESNNENKNTLNDIYKTNPELLIGDKDTAHGLANVFLKNATTRTWAGVVARNGGIQLKEEALTDSSNLKEVILKEFDKTINQSNKEQFFEDKNYTIVIPIDNYKIQRLDR